MKRLFVSAAVAALALTSAACATAKAPVNTSINGNSGQAPLLTGTRPTFNTSPMDSATQCFAQATRLRETPLRVAVGQIRDYTGKFSNEASEGGFRITQGGALMVMTALGKLEGIEQVERFDMEIASSEANLVRGQLIQDLTADLNTGAPVSLRNLTAGQYYGSDYYIVGGITEVNYAIRTGGNTGSFTSDNGDLGAKTWQANIAAGQLNAIGQAGAANAFHGYGTIAGEGVAFQLNDQTSQVATVNIDRIGVGANIDSASAVAVGNSLSFSAPNGNASALAFQTNSSTQQMAALNVSNIGVSGASSFNASSIGNIGSWESQTYQASDGITFQTNVSALQNSVVNVTGSGFTGGLNTGSISAGNVANIGTRF